MNDTLNNFYDSGWNARCAGEPFTSASSRSWQDGWKDCDGVPEASRVPMGDPPLPPLHLTDAQIKHMVDRFLGWKLPENFRPDDGISFDPIMNRGHAFESRRTPSGTNLLDADQARAMVQYITEGLPKG